MKKYSILLGLLLSSLSACTSTKVLPVDTTMTKDNEIQKVEKVVAINVNCAILARYTKNVAILRDAGVQIDDVILLINDAPDKLPLFILNREIYNRADMSPDESQKNSYEVCKTNGYENMVNLLISAERKYNEELSKKVSAELSAKKNNKKILPQKKR